jgi:hypothetical protein
VVIGLIVAGVFVYKKMQSNSSGADAAVRYAPDSEAGGDPAAPPAFGNVEHPPSYSDVFGQRAIASAPGASTLFPKA